MLSAPQSGAQSAAARVNPSDPSHATAQFGSTRAKLRTPAAAAVAGLVFSLLLVVILLLLRLSVPSDPQESGAWLASQTRQVEIAMNLVPFAGIAFLWFIGVLRDRLGEREDRFFSTVFFGSGLLFLAMLFMLAALSGGILTASALRPHAMIDSELFHFARATTYNLANIYMIKMAAVFMAATSTLAFFTGILPRWIAIAGFALAVVLLLVGQNIAWSFLVFPVWVTAISISILRSNFLERRIDRCGRPETGKKEPRS
jgi:hypothetical protein